MHISLFERLLNEGKAYFTDESKIEKPIEHQNVLEWANSFVYKKKLRPLESEYQLPLVNGFSWPSFEYRVCFLHVPSFEPNLNYLAELCEIGSKIAEQVLKSGYTQP